MLKPPLFLTDQTGQRIAVVLDVADYERMLEDLEDLEDIRASDQALASGEGAIPLDQAVEQIERRKE